MYEGYVDAANALACEKSNVVCFKIKPVVQVSRDGNSNKFTWKKALSVKNYKLEVINTNTNKTVYTAYPGANDTSAKCNLAKGNYKVVLYTYFTKTYSPSDGSGSFDSISSDAVNFTAVDSTYTITYNANGGTGAPANQTKIHDTALTLSSTKPTRDGYTFVNWNTKADGTGTTYTAGQNYYENANVTLYAQWLKYYYFDLSGYVDGNNVNNINNFGTADVYINGNLVANDVVDYYQPHPGGTKFEIKDIKAKDGKQYNGVYSGTLSGTINGTTTTILNFSTKKYTVTYNANGGTNAPANQTKVHGTTLTLSSQKPTRDGYAFVKWTTNANGTGTSYNAGAQYTTNAGVTLYAQWQQKPTQASIAVSKRAVIYGDTVSFTFSGNNNTTKYWLGIDKRGTTTRVLTKELSTNTFSISTLAAGDYVAYISAENAAGLCQSNKVEFTVWSTPANLGDSFRACIENTGTGSYITNQNPNINCVKYDGSKAQIWKFTRLSNNAYRIDSELNGGCMSIEGGSNFNDGANISTASYSGTENQQFYIFNVNNAYYLTPVFARGQKMVDEGVNSHNIASWVSVSQNFKPQEFNIRKIYAATYNANGGTNAPAAQTQGDSIYF